MNFWNCLPEHTTTADSVNSFMGEFLTGFVLGLMLKKISDSC